MPLALLIVGIVLIVTAFRGTYKELGSLVVNDLVGSSGFIVWIAVLVIIGLIGYIPKMEKISRAFIGLVLLVLFLANGGFFDKFRQAIQGASVSPAPTNTEPKFPGSLPIKIEGGGGGKGGGGIGDIAGAVSSVAGLFGG